MVIYRAYWTELISVLDLDKDASYRTPEQVLGTRISWEPLLSVRAAKMKLRVTEIPGDEPARIGGERKLQIWKWGAAYYYQFLREFFVWKKPLLGRTWGVVDRYEDGASLLRKQRRRESDSRRTSWEILGTATNETPRAAPLVSVNSRWIRLTASRRQLVQSEIRSCGTGSCCEHSGDATKASFSPPLSAAGLLRLGPKKRRATTDHSDSTDKKVD